MFSHYRRKFHETEAFYFYVSSKGEVYKYPVTELDNLSSAGMLPIQPKFFGADAIVRIGTDKFKIKVLVAKMFSKNWQPKSLIGFKDGVPTNCNITNLTINGKDAV